MRPYKRSTSFKTFQFQLAHLATLLQFVLQKKALRIIYNFARDHHSAQPFQTADIPKVFNICRLRLVLRYTRDKEYFLNV